GQPHASVLVVRAHLLHREVELHGVAVRGPGAQRLALARLVAGRHAPGGQAAVAVEALEVGKGVRRRDAERGVPQARRRTLLEAEGPDVELLVRPQVDGAGLAVMLVQAQQPGVEVAGALQVGDREGDVPEAQDHAAPSAASRNSKWRRWNSSGCSHWGQ